MRDEVESASLIAALSSFIPYPYILSPNSIAHARRVSKFRMEGELQKEFVIAYVSGMCGIEL